MIASTTKANTTTLNTAGIRHKPQRRKRMTSGASKNENNTANANGMKISRAK